MKLCSFVISKTELYCNVLSPNSNTHISLRDLYLSRIGLSIFWTDPGNILIAQRLMNVGTGTEAA